MKKHCTFLMACLAMTWGCASVVYVSQETGKGQLMSAADEVPLQPSALFVTAHDDSMPDVSRDGKWVAFKRVVGGVDLPAPGQRVGVTVTGPVLAYPLT